MSPSTEPRFPAPHLAPMRRRGITALAGLLLVAALGGCAWDVRPATSDDALSRVLGVYEIDVSGIGTDAMTASFRRVDGDGDVERSALGTTPIGGLTFSDVAVGTETTGGYTYLWLSANVDLPNATTRTNLTFVAYSSKPPGQQAIGGSAFVEVRDSAGVLQNDLATSITPTLGVAPSTGLVLNPEGLSTVFYSEGEVASLIGSPNIGGKDFVNTVLPYGFVVTKSDGLGRTIDSSGGILRMGVRVPAVDPPVNRLRLWTVAVVDDAVRVALPPEYNSRDADGNDNLAVFADPWARSTASTFRGSCCPTSA